ncbi:MAG: hypothetical protein GY757_04025, partial [bacterium]|nr:hypothetical protein [bacterium]
MEMKKNQLPSGWKDTKLGDLCEVVRGGSPRPMGDPRYFSGKIPFIKIADITRIKGDKVFDANTKVNEEGAKRSRLLRKGSLILSNSGTVCVPKFLGVDACIHDGFVTFLDLSEGITLKFLFHYFNFLRPYVIQKHRQGITQVNLNTTIVREFEVMVPPLSEQHRIVGKIEELFSDLDAGIDSLKKARAQLKIYRQAVLKYAFEGKLTQQWRNRRQGTLEPAEVLLNKICDKRDKWIDKEIQDGKNEAKRLKNKLKKHEFKNPNIELPAKWSWTSLLESCQLVVDCHNKTAPYENKGIYLIRTSNIRSGKLNLTRDIRFVSEDTYRYWSRRCYPNSGDLLFTREAPMGEVA